MYLLNGGVLDQDLNATLHEVPILLKHGADVNLEDSDGNTALDYAVLTGVQSDYTLMQLFIKKRTEDSMKIIQMLIAHHADVNHKNKYMVSRWGHASGGMTPLMLASRECGGDIVKLLISLGADAGLKTQAGDTAFSLALASAAAGGRYEQACTATVHILQK